MSLPAKTGSGKYNMATVKTEVVGLITFAHTISTATPTFFTMPDLDMALSTTPDVARLPKIKMGSPNRKWK